MFESSSTLWPSGSFARGFIDEIPASSLASVDGKGTDDVKAVPARRELASYL